MAFLPILLLIPLWFLLVRPQQKRLRAQQEMVRSLRVGDEIVTSGGIYGTIVELDAEIALVEVAEGVRLRVARVAVGQRLTPRADESPPPDELRPSARPDAVDEPEPDGPGGSHPTTSE